MDYQLLSFAVLIPVAIVAYSAGAWSKEYPSEEEMMRRIIRARVERRIEAEVEAAISDEINRQAARS
jgi:hypothetical protein